MKKQNKVLWGAMAFSLAATLLVIYLPFLADIFSLKPLTVYELAVSVGFAVLVVPVIEVVKAVQRTREQRKNSEGTAQ